MLKCKHSILVLVLVTSATIAGCGAKGDSTSSKSSSPATQPSPPPAATSSPAGLTSASAPAAATDGDIPGIRVAINELKRTSNTVTLKFTLYNDTDKEFDGYAKFSEDPYKGYRNFGGVHLVDTESKKKYFAVADSDNKCLCSDEVAALAKNTSVALWVKFPALPDDVQKITVQIPHFIPMDDIPVTR